MGAGTFASLCKRFFQDAGTGIVLFGLCILYPFLTPDNDPTFKTLNIVAVVAGTLCLLMAISQFVGHELYLRRRNKIYNRVCAEREQQKRESNG